MAIRVTYADGHVTDYDDRTFWEIEHGVLKLGARTGKWDLYVSPAAWQTVDPDPQ